MTDNERPTPWTTDATHLLIYDAPNWVETKQSDDATTNTSEPAPCSKPSCFVGFFPPQILLFCVHTKKSHIHSV